jgi:hypothetical protein
LARNDLGDPVAWTGSFGCHALRLAKWEYRLRPYKTECEANAFIQLILYYRGGCKEKLVKIF